MAVFVADVSGSMGGAPIQNLQSSLINASQYINDSNYVGLVSYSTNVAINLPIARFDLNQRSYFTGAVGSLTPGGNTATYDAVLVALDMLTKAQAETEAETGEHIKPLLFVLSDGEQNVGASLREITPIVGGLEIPVYTIGYNANLSALQELSAINEAASINADNDDVIYNLKSLFNAQM
ncbi:MAG: VWA domain-containing protein [Oscillospiraceae bacterium]|nr:VWA domain-containing protein [Oscillospiraceae bacterium]